MNDIRLGLIGHDISYSKSSDIFDSIFRLTGQGGSFELFDFAPTQLADWLKTAALALDGFAATIPHKQQLLRHLDQIDPRAKAIGAVNSVAVTGGQLHGYNTDYHGVMQSLKDHGSKISGRAALILGTGGAARAVVQALVREFKVSRLVIASRSLSSAERFRVEHERKLGGIDIEIGVLDQPQWSLADVGVVVNCTPLAGFNHAQEVPLVDFAVLAGDVYFDLNYNRPNLAVAMAREAGMSAIDGARMLVEQAVESYRLWAGMQVDADQVLDDVFGGAQK